MPAPQLLMTGILSMKQKVMSAVLASILSMQSITKSGFPF